MDKEQLAQEFWAFINTQGHNSNFLHWMKERGFDKTEINSLIRQEYLPF